MAELELSNALVTEITDVRNDDLFYAVRDGIPAPGTSHKLQGINAKRAFAMGMVLAHTYATGSGTAGDPWVGWNDDTPLEEGSTIFLQQGYYEHDDPDFNWGVRRMSIIGGGTGAVIRYTGSSAGNVFALEFDAHETVARLENLILDGQDNTNARVALYCKNACGTHIRNVRVINTVEHGFLFQGCIGVVIEFPVSSNLDYIDGVGDANLQVPTRHMEISSYTGNGAEGCTCFTITGYVSEGGAAGSYAVHVSNSFDILWLGGFHEISSGKGVHVAGSARLITFDSYDIEASDETNWEIEGQVTCRNCAGESITFGGSSRTRLDACQINGVVPPTNGAKLLVDGSLISGTGVGAQYGTATGSFFYEPNVDAIWRQSSTTLFQSLPDQQGPGGPKTRGSLFPGASFAPDLKWRQHHAYIANAVNFVAPVNGVLSNGYELEFRINPWTAGYVAPTFDSSIYLAPIPTLSATALAEDYLKFRYFIDLAKFVLVDCRIQENPKGMKKLGAQTVNSTQVTIAHGLGRVPKTIEWQMTSAGTIWISQAADSTNIYLTADQNSRTATVDVW